MRKNLFFLILSTVILLSCNKTSKDNPHPEVIQDSYVGHYKGILIDSGYYGNVLYFSSRKTIEGDIFLDSNGLYVERNLFFGQADSFFYEAIPFKIDSGIVHCDGFWYNHDGYAYASGTIDGQHLSVSAKFFRRYWQPTPDYFWRVTHGEYEKQ